MTGPKGSARPPLPRARVPEAAAQLHVVGEPQGPGGTEPLRRRLPRARQHRRLRPLPAAADRRSSRAGRRHRLDGVLLQHDALHGAGAGERRPGLRGPRLQVLRALHRHRATRSTRSAARGCGARTTGSTTTSSMWAAGTQALRVRSLVGLMPLIAVEVLDEADVRAPAGLPEADEVVPGEPAGPARPDRLHEADDGRGRAVQRLLAIPSRERLERVLRYLLDESEFLSPHGIRSVSRVHREHPYEIDVNGEIHRVDYAPAERQQRPVRRQLELARAGVVPDQLPAARGAGALPPLLRRRPQGGVPGRVGPDAEPPGGRRRSSTARLAALFLPDASGRRPCHGERRALRRPIPTGRTWCCSTSTSTATTAAASGASHQTGWTALVAPLHRGPGAPAGRTRRRARPKSPGRLAASRR